MKTFKAIYNHICRSKYETQGFFRYKNTFMRIKGDVLQSFSLIKSHLAPEFYVEFDICPLCLPMSFFCCGKYRLDDLIIENRLNGCAWEVDTSSEESMVYWAEKISHEIDTRIMPLFDKCTDSESSLRELFKLEELYEEIRLEFLRKKGWPDCAPMSVEESRYWDDRFYYMAIKSGNWNFAQLYLSYRIKYYENEISNINQGINKQPQVVKERFAEAISLFSDHLNRIKNGDHRFFSNLILCNEKQNLDLLSNICPKLINNK